MILLIFAPLLNDICENLSKKKLSFLCMLQIIFISMYSTITPFQDTTLCNILWFFFMYFFVYYLKKYCLYTKYSSERLFITAGIIYLLLTTVVIFIQESQNILGEYDILKYVYKIILQWLADFKSIPSFTIAVLIFIGLLNVNSFTSNFINSISASTFAVYILHQIPGFYSILWKKVFCIDKYINTVWYLPYIILVVVVIFIVAIILDYIRINTVERIFLNSKFIKNICKNVDAFYNGLKRD